MHQGNINSLWVIEKETLSGRLTWIIFLFGHCRVNCYYFLTNVMNLPIKMKYFATRASIKFWLQLMGCLINCMRVVCRLEIFIQSWKHSDVTWEDFLATRFALWIDTRSDTDTSLDRQIWNLMNTFWHNAKKLEKKLKHEQEFARTWVCNVEEH